MPSRDGLDLDPDERLLFRGDDRLGGEVVVTDERVLVVDDDPTSVPLTNVESVVERDIDWFLAVLGVAIVGFGVVSLDRHLLGGIAFVLAGIGSLGLTWRRRERVRIHTHTHPKPVDCHPESPKAFLAALDDALAPIREERPPE